jgi:hypothetical protein
MRAIRSITIGAALLVAGCGGDPAAGGKADPRDGALKFAQCMRGQGINFPDPKIDEDGSIELGGPNVGAPDRAKMERAQTACQKHLDAGRPELSDAERAKVRTETLAHARCMREHGLDFPDPTFDEHGGASVRIGRGSGIDPRSPKFQRAQEACAKFIKGGGKFGVKAAK